MLDPDITTINLIIKLHEQGKNQKEIKSLVYAAQGKNEDGTTAIIPATIIFVIILIVHSFK